jgi:hypothetical protein
MENSNNGFIYAIQATSLRHIKIGFTYWPDKRLRDLQTGSPDKLNRTGILLAGCATERQNCHSARYLEATHNPIRIKTLHFSWF